MFEKPELWKHKQRPTKSVVFEKLLTFWWTFLKFWYLQIDRIFGGVLVKSENLQWWNLDKPLSPKLSSDGSPYPSTYRLPPLDPTTFLGDTMNSVERRSSELGGNEWAWGIPNILSLGTSLCGALTSRQANARLLAECSSAGTCAANNATEKPIAVVEGQNGSPEPTTDLSICGRGACVH